MKKIHRLLTAVAACGFLMAGQPARADKAVTGASLLTQQRPFYVLLADAVKQGAGRDGVSLQRSIFNQDLNKRPSDVEGVITKGVNASGVKGAMSSFGCFQTYPRLLRGINHACHY